MIFLNYTLLIILATYLAFVSASVWAFHFVRYRRPLLRIGVCSLATITVAGSTLLAGPFGIFALREISSAPVYSPDRKQALRVDYEDDGALGGVTFVELYSNHGFHSRVIFSQEGRTVHAENLRWVSNSEILIPYSVGSSSDHPWVCAAQCGLTVSCEKIPAQAWR